MNRAEDERPPSDASLHPEAFREATTAGLLAPGSSFDGAFPSAMREVADAVVVPGYSGGGRAGITPDFPSTVVADWISNRETPRGRDAGPF